MRRPARRFWRAWASAASPPSACNWSAWLPSSTAHLALYEQIDIALDPFPYNGTTTTCEALWMGVPVVTLRGDRHCARVGASLLSQAGLTDWIAGSVDDYLEIALALAANPEQLDALRRSLRQRVAASSLCDGDGFARKMENAYRTIWKSWCQAPGASIVDKQGSLAGAKYPPA